MFYSTVYSSGLSETCGSDIFPQIWNSEWVIDRGILVASNTWVTVMVESRYGITADVNSRTNVRAVGAR